MGASVVTQEDLNYLAQQSEGKMNLIISGMTAVLSDTDKKIASMESQTWFQRMVKTVTGKNRVTKEEIRQNSDRLNAYMVEAITELYNRNCIDHEIIISLGMQLNQVYAEHLQLKQMLGAFVSKLNEKIESVDNFHMLTTEIEQGVYSGTASIISICKVLSQFDNRILDEPRKLDIIRRDMMTQGIVCGDERPICEYLADVVDIPINEVGVIYMELGTMKGNFIADILVRMIENYHLLPDLTRKLKHKDAVIRDVICREGIDDSAVISTELIYNEFINTKIDIRDGISLLPNTEAESQEFQGTTDDDKVDTALQEVYDLFLDYKINAVVQLCEELAEKENGRAMYLLAKTHGNGYGHFVKDPEKAAFWGKKGFQANDILAARLYAGNLENDSIEQLRIYKDVFPKILNSAENGDVLAQYELMWSYEFGYGTQKDVYKAFEWGLKAAEQGLWAAMYRVAYYYEEGIGCDKDEVKAFNMYMKAAECGYDEAMDSIGICFRNGMGVPKSDTKGFEWYMKAANAGNAWGMYHVAKSYLLEIGIEKSAYQSHVWCEKAANKGHLNAMMIVAENYEHGPLNSNNVYADENKAFYWWKKAAELGDARAQRRLARCYQNGVGTPQNSAKAKEWDDKATANGDTSYYGGGASFYD